MYPVENFTLDSKLLHNQRLWWLWQIWGMDTCNINCINGLSGCGYKIAHHRYKSSCRSWQRNKPILKWPTICIKMASDWYLFMLNMPKNTNTTYRKIYKQMINSQPILKWPPMCVKMALDQPSCRITDISMILIFMTFGKIFVILILWNSEKKSLWSWNI